MASAWRVALPNLLVATNNPGKLREFEALLDDPTVTLTSPAMEQIHLRIAETGRTYAENATLKATAFARASGLPTLADDSGIEIDALHGRPGVRSARFGGPRLSDRDRLLLVLRLLRQVPIERRTARFRAVVVLAVPGGPTAQAQGICEGLVSFAPRGSAGFGYDPIFYLPQYGLTMAQLPNSIKNRVSHRARATSKIRPRLREFLQTT